VLIWLIVFLLLGLIVCLPGRLALPPVPGVAAMAVSFPTSPVVPARCALTAGFARDTARIGHTENEDRPGCAEGAGRAGGGPSTRSRAVAVAPIVRAAAIVRPPVAGP
jgi:hypothetical protein